MTTTYLDRIRYVDELNELEKLSLIDISYSRLNTVLDGTYGCGLKYFYNYILKIPSGSNQYAVLGNIVHRALENTLKNDQPLDEVTLFAEFEWAREHYDPNNAVEDKVISMGKVMLREYFDRHKKDKYSSRISIYPKILGKELSFEVVISTGKIRGYIDFVYELGDDLYVIDYKTGSTEVANYKVPTNTQLGIYALAMKKAYPDKTIHASLYYLKSNKLKTHTYSDEDYEGVLSTLEEQITDLVNTSHFKPTENVRTCYSCDYAQKQICPTGKSRLKQKTW